MIFNQEYFVIHNLKLIYNRLNILLNNFLRHFIKKPSTIKMKNCLPLQAIKNLTTYYNMDIIMSDDECQKKQLFIKW